MPHNATLYNFLTICFLTLVRKGSGPVHPKPTRYPSWREYSTFDADEELTPLNAVGTGKSVSISMCTSGQQANPHGAGSGTADRTSSAGGVEILSEDVKVINNLIEDLSRLDPSDPHSQRRLLTRHDTGFTVETEFQTGGPLHGRGGGGNAVPGKIPGPGGVLGPLRKTSLVSNNSRSSKQQQQPPPSTVVPTLAEKQPGITEQVRSEPS